MDRKNSDKGGRHRRPLQGHVTVRRGDVEPPRYSAALLALRDRSMEVTRNSAKLVKLCASVLLQRAEFALLN